MLILGVFIGSHQFNIIHPDVIVISDDLRRIALIIILLRAGFGIDNDDLKKVGFTALKMGCIPGLIEGLCIAFTSMKFLNFTFVQVLSPDVNS